MLSERARKIKPSPPRHRCQGKGDEGFRIDVINLGVGEPDLTRL